jgi:hypothetical protein
MWNYDPSNHPTCNIVIEKSGEEEKVCGSPAAQMVTLVDPNDQSRVLAVVLLCEKHDQDFENYKSMIAVSENGTDRIAVQKDPKRKVESENDANAS